MSTVMEAIRMKTTDVQAEPAPMPTPGSPSLFSLLPGSLLVYAIPPLSRSWPRATVFRAATVAVLNTLAGFAWLYAVLVCLSVHVVLRPFQSPLEPGAGG